MNSLEKFLAALREALYMDHLGDLVAGEYANYLDLVRSITSDERHIVRPIGFNIESAQTWGVGLDVACEGVVSVSGDVNRGLGDAVNIRGVGAIPYRETVYRSTARMQAVHLREDAQAGWQLRDVDYGQGWASSRICMHGPSSAEAAGVRASSRLIGRESR